MKSPLYKQLFDYIRDEITSGRLKPGDRVPSEKELAEQFNVSRITSKKALEMLFDEAFIERIQGKGSYVRTSIPQPYEDGEKPLPARHGRLIGLVLPDAADVYGLRLLRAVQQACRAQQAFVVLELTYGQQQQEEQAIRALLDLGVDGLIVFPVHGEYYNPELLRAVLSDFPVALVDRYLKGIPAPTVCTDNVRAAHTLTAYLLDRGHQHIAFVSPPVENTSTIEERLRGFAEAFRARGLTLDPQHILNNLYSTMPQNNNDKQTEADQATLRAFRQAHPEITAFVASEYNIALLLDHSFSGDLQRPEIVCFDSPEMPYGAPRFTHIRQDESLMGESAVRLLFEQFEGKREPTAVLLDFECVEARIPTS